jgi:hypothetical protein
VTKPRAAPGERSRSTAAIAPRQRLIFDVQNAVDVEQHRARRHAYMPSA